MSDDLWTDEEWEEIENQAENLRAVASFFYNLTASGGGNFGKKEVLKCVAEIEEISAALRKIGGA